MQWKIQNTGYNLLLWLFNTVYKLLWLSIPLTENFLEIIL